MRAHCTLGLNNKENIMELWTVIQWFYRPTRALLILFSPNKLWIGLVIFVYKNLVSTDKKVKAFHAAQTTFDFLWRRESTWSQEKTCWYAWLRRSRYRVTIELERENIMAEGVIISITAIICVIMLGAEKCQGHKGIRVNSYYCKIYMIFSPVIYDLTALNRPSHRSRK